MKLLNLVLNHAAEEWKRPPRKWFEAKTQFAVSRLKSLGYAVQITPLAA